MTKDFIKFSVCDMLKQGIGPSSSHTLAPWRAAQDCYKMLHEGDWLQDLVRVKVTLYGSLAFVGRGHYTTVALPLGLLNKDVMEFDISTQLQDALGISSVQKICEVRRLSYSATHCVDYEVDFDYEEDKDKEKMVFAFTYGPGTQGTDRPDKLVYYSYGGGSYGSSESLEPPYEGLTLPYQYNSAAQLMHLLDAESRRARSVSDAIFENELSFADYREKNPDDSMEGLPKDRQGIFDYLKNIAVQMGKLIYAGCTHRDDDDSYKIMYATPRAKRLFNSLIGQSPTVRNGDVKTFFDHVIEKSHEFTFAQIVELVSIFALAVSEQNSALKHVVTAPTNGSCGTVPAVLYYYVVFHASDVERDWLFGTAPHPEPLNGILRFLLTASTVGGVIKQNANISGGVGGCQAEIGTSAAMAAGSLAEALGGQNPTVTFNAAEAALEAQLGSTCDPIGGLVEIPCIDRNVTASVMAITLGMEMVRLGAQHVSTVPFDKTVLAMANISADMHERYKETSTGGLALVMLDDVKAKRPDVFPPGSPLTDERAEVNRRAKVKMPMFRTTC